jgi:hypothetical protein
VDGGVAGVEEPLLAQSPPAVDDLAMHDGDLAGGSAEGDELELEPEAEGLAERAPGPPEAAPCSAPSAGATAAGGGGRSVIWP